MSQANPFPPPTRSLEALLREVDSPGVLRSDIDALIAALARAPVAGERPQARAAVLKPLTARDHPLGEHTGSDGRTVREAAAAGLRALGPAYVKDVPPELEARPRAPVRTGPGPWTWVMAVTSLLLQFGFAITLQVLIPMPFIGVDFDNPSSTLHLVADVVVTFLVLAAPLALSVYGLHEKNRRLHVLGSGGLWAEAVIWGLISLVLLVSGELAPLVIVLPWHVALGTAFALRPKREPEPATGA